MRQLYHILLHISSNNWELYQAVVCNLEVNKQRVSDTCAFYMIYAEKQFFSLNFRYSGLLFISSAKIILFFQNTVHFIILCFWHRFEHNLRVSNLRGIDNLLVPLTQFFYFSVISQLNINATLVIMVNLSREIFRYFFNDFFQKHTGLLFHSLYEELNNCTETCTHTTEPWMINLNCHFLLLVVLYLFTVQGETTWISSILLKNKPNLEQTPNNSGVLILDIPFIFFLVLASNVG